MEIADIIQLFILIVLVVTAYFAIKTTSETRKIHEETLLWNKKNITIEALQNLREVNIEETREKFISYIDKGKEIPIEEILKVIKENPKISTEIIKYLNYHQVISLGIKKNLYDEELVRLSRKISFLQTYTEFKNFIKYRRSISNKNAWKEYEELVELWKN